jgi:hypothetical protein
MNNTIKRKHKLWLEVSFEVTEKLSQFKLLITYVWVLLVLLALCGMKGVVIWVVGAQILKLNLGPQNYLFTNV